ncbi:MAG: hypothetical protein AAF944_09995 [Bacteroidota bacterium]
MSIYYKNNRSNWLRTAIICCLLSSLSHYSFSQNQPAQEEDSIYYQRPSILDKIAPGGNFSLQFGTITYIEVSPMVGYRFTNKFMAGPGITYRYFKVRGFEASSIYGPRAFARYVINRQFFVQSEYENLSVEFPTGDPRAPVTREWVPGLFVGGGLFQPIGERAGFMIGAFYNLSHDNIRSPYNSPWVFNVGFTL